jgi:hypothetical protein
MQMAAIRHYCDEFKVLVAINEKCSSASVEAEEAAAGSRDTRESNLVPPYKSAFGRALKPKARLTRRLSPKKKAATQHQVSLRVTRKSSSHKNGAVSLI